MGKVSPGAPELNEEDDEREIEENGKEGDEEKKK